VAHCKVKILEHLRERDRDDMSNIIHMLETFYFRNHMYALGVISRRPSAPLRACLRVRPQWSLGWTFPLRTRTLTARVCVGCVPCAVSPVCAVAARQRSHV
jgi:hypothetical protein